MGSLSWTFYVSITFHARNNRLSSLPALVVTVSAVTSRLVSVERYTAHSAQDVHTLGIVWIQSIFSENESKGTMLQYKASSTTTAVLWRLVISALLHPLLARAEDGSSFLFSHQHNTR